MRSRPIYSLVIIGGAVALSLPWLLQLEITYLWVHGCTLEYTCTQAFNRTCTCTSEGCGEVPVGRLTSAAILRMSKGGTSTVHPR
eukprot:2099855-Alexandrium_andersonii.AAC.1